MESFHGVIEQNATNPWSENEIHCFDLILGNQEIEDDSSHQQEINSEPRLSKIDKQIEMLRDSMITSRELYKTKAKIDANKNQKLAGNLTSLDSLNSKFKTVKEMVEKLELVVKNQDKVQTILQHPYSGPQIKMDAQYHASTVELFQTASKSLVDLSDQLSLIDWCATESTESSENVKERLNDLIGRTESLKKIANS